MQAFNVLEVELETARKIFWLLREDEIFLSSYNHEKDDWDDGAYPAINCNDLFVPGADAEKLDAEDLDKYIEVIKKYGDVGAAAWCAAKRNAKLWRTTFYKDDWHKRYDIAVKEITAMLSQGVN